MSNLFKKARLFDAETQITAQVMIQSLR